MPRRDPFAATETALRNFALTFPETIEEFPWDHRAIKVRRKIFVIFSRDNDRFNVTVKLPVSGTAALEMPFVEPTGYGLGKSGWVTAAFAAGDPVPTDLVCEWIDESFRAVAPKTVVAKLERVGSDEPEGKPARKPNKRKK